MARWLLAHHWPEESHLLLPQSKATVSQEKKTLIEAQLQRLLAHEPIQYVLQEAWFDSLRLKVTPDVLIPRPETEELVHWAVALSPSPRRALDVGTGSGCIPLALSQYWPNTSLYGWDVSESALKVARQNAADLNKTVHWDQIDVLDTATWPETEQVDVVISNPPYIPYQDAGSMEKRVVHFEPEVALFVPDNDPLIFYRLLMELSQTYLSPDGWLIVEIHEGRSEEVKQLWQEMGGQQIQVKKDWQGKPRMMACQKKSS